MGAGATLSAYDPVAMPKAAQWLGSKVVLATDPYEAAEGADALVLVTEWNEFRQLDFSRLRSVMKQAVVFDGRNVWNPGEMRKAGFKYFGVGRSASPA